MLTGLSANSLCWAILTIVHWTPPGALRARVPVPLCVCACVHACSPILCVCVCERVGAGWTQNCCLCVCRLDSQLLCVCVCRVDSELLCVCVCVCVPGGLRTVCACVRARAHTKLLQLCLFLMAPWTVAHQGPPSMGFSRQFWSRLPCPSPGDLPNPGTEPSSGGSFTTNNIREAQSPLQTYIPITQ